jgi:CheY-like chemotaxis protein
MAEAKKRVLVVDDDEMHLNIARELLEDDRLEVTTLHCGFGALQLVQELQPDLILLDINMPEVSGDKLALQLQDQSCARHMQIVFYSSNDEDSLREIVAACDVAGYISKGDISNLKKYVNRYLDAEPVDERRAG